MTDAALVLGFVFGVGVCLSPFIVCSIILVGWLLTDVPEFPGEGDR